MGRKVFFFPSVYTLWKGFGCGCWCCSSIFNGIFLRWFLFCLPVPTHHCQLSIHQVVTTRPALALGRSNYCNWTWMVKFKWDFSKRNNINLVRQNLALATGRKKKPESFPFYAGVEKMIDMRSSRHKSFEIRPEGSPRHSVKSRPKFKLLL